MTQGPGPIHLPGVTGPPGLSPIKGIQPQPPAGGDFKNSLLSALDEVNRLQQEASQSVEKLATGESDNVAEVLSSVRKADVAFSLLMEMRNKLVDAYRELQQMRV